MGIAQSTDDVALNHHCAVRSSDHPTNSAQQQEATEPGLPPLGSHLVTPRRGYLHHGIYVGEGNVVHYSGLANGFRRGPVEEVSITTFSREHPIRVVSDAHTRFSPQEVVRRARSRLGENSYRLLTNNCKHFCQWCLHRQERRYEVEARWPAISRQRSVIAKLGAQIFPALLGRASLSDESSTIATGRVRLH